MKLIILGIFAFIFYLCLGTAKLVSDGANLIAGTKRNSISRENTPNDTFYEFFNIHIAHIRKNKPYELEPSTIDEMLLAIELYFYFISIVFYTLQMDSERANNFMLDHFLNGILRYIDLNQYLLNFTPKSDYDKYYKKTFYTIPNLKEMFFIRYEEYIRIFDKMPQYKGGLMNSTEDLVSSVMYENKRILIIKTHFYRDLKEHVKQENQPNVYKHIMSSKNTKALSFILLDISVMAANFTKSLILSAFNNR